MLRPASLFRPGEGYADTPATCDNAGPWIEKFLAFYGRVTMTTRGPLTIVEEHDPLTYLIMCPQSGVQVLCVIYSRDGMQTGDVVRSQMAIRVLARGRSYSIHALPPGDSSFTTLQDQHAA